MKLDFAEQIKKKLETGEWKGLPEYEANMHDTWETDVDNLLESQTSKADYFRRRFRLRW